MRVPIITWLRKSRTFKILTAYAGLNFLAEVCFPSVAWALTSGPAQEEFASFEPVSTSDMVDIYSGDFTYNIPLLSVPGPNGGYPINLAYHSGVGMDQEASWVGLGWNINVGAINRQLRGLPDDFQGDPVTQKMNLRTNTTIGLNLPVPPLHSGQEIFGLPPTPKDVQCTPVSWQVYYNNYKGLGYRAMTTCDPFSKTGSSPVSVGISFDSQNGIGIEPNLSLNFGHKEAGLAFNFGLSINSRQGLQDYSFAANIMARSNPATMSEEHIGQIDFHSGGGFKSSSNLSFNTIQSVPPVTIPTKTSTYPFDVKIGNSPIWGTFNFKFPGMWSGYVSRTRVQDGGILTKDAYGYLNTDQAATSDDDLKDFQRDYIPYSKKIPNLATSSHTYDLYMQTGQGTGGMFRPYYSSAGILADAKQESPNNTFRLNLEFGTGQSTHVGAGFTLGAGSHTSGTWSDPQNDIDQNLLNGFYNNSFSAANDQSYERYYFQMYGEKTGVLLNDLLDNDLFNDENQLEYWKDDQAVRINLEKEGGWLTRHFQAKDEFVYDALSSGFVLNSDPAYKYKLNRDKSYRQRRGNMIQMFTEDEAVGNAAKVGVGLTKAIGYSVSGNTYTTNLKTVLPSPQYGGHNHHISEFSMLQPDGMRYVYGLPAYNTKQMDASFSVDYVAAGCSTACSPNPYQGDFNTPTVCVPNDGNNIIPPQPKKAELETSPYPEFLSQTELPPYVHSWLLTAVVSADYVDLTGDGPSDDDYGYWVKFNYEKKVPNFKWRVPYQDAMFSEGYKSDPTDDKGSFTYGEKDLYYLNSIETKTHIAIFELSARRDGLSAADKFAACNQNGTQEMQKIDRIKLYSKKDFFSTCSKTNEELLTTYAYAANANAVPIKTIHFRYSYSLCPNVPNNSGQAIDENGGDPADTQLPDVNALKGKLTLESLFFTYQNSDRGKHSPYVFDYGTMGTLIAPSEDNPHYNNRDIDRWGNYKPNSINYPHSPGNPNFYPYIDFPYTEQTDYNANSSTYLQNKVPNVAVWSLKDIDLPSGGTIHVNYESDDYGYVENRRAARMYDIVGIGIYKTDAEERSAGPISNNLNESINPNDGFKIYFMLDSITPVTTTNDYIAENYMKGIDSLYFKVEVNLINGYRDYVSGYAEIDKDGGYGFDAANKTPDNLNYKFGYITLKPVKISKLNNTPVNPIQRSAIEHLRANRSELVHTPTPQATSLLAQIGNVMGQTIGLITELDKTLHGFNFWAFGQGYCNQLFLNGHSVIRLQDPDGQKYGGGVRVKKLTINDNWTNSDPDAFEYGQSYDYTIIENDEQISSGVAYEPHIGREESALSNAVPYELSTPLSSAYKMFVEAPVMESYYPGPSIGYRKVTVRSIAPAEAKKHNNQNELIKSAAPISVYEFYSPKDFPVTGDQTDLNSNPSITRFLLIPGIYSDFRKKKGRSQGYSIILNDMSGKLKSLTQMTITGTVISKQEHIYHTLHPYDPNKVNRLSNKVQVLTSEASYQTAIIGQSHDIFIDMNENRESSIQGGLDLNLDIVIPPFIPFFIMPVPFIANSESSLRTVVTMKIIHRTGILKEVITTTDESVIKTENIAYDLQTGEPLLTKVTNEFKDPVFNMSFPAHWFYPNMAGAYKNAGVTFTGQTVTTNGRVSLSGIPSGKNAGDYFTVGDEVFVNYSSGTTYSACNGTSPSEPLDNVYTVAHVFSSPGNFINLIDRCGNYAQIGSDVSLKIVRSGYRNLQTLKAGNLVAKTYSVTPFDPETTPEQVNTFTFTIDASNKIIDASAIQFHDRGQTECGICEGEGARIPAPGTIVNPWHEGLLGIWKPRRSFAFVTNRLQNGNIREDGTFDDFSLFDWRSPWNSSVNWVAANTITKYSPFGFELENKDAIGRYSAALYEHDNSLVTVVGANAQTKELAFDGFEDYKNLLCEGTCDAVDHFGFLNYVLNVQNTHAHSGNYSISVPVAADISASRPITTTDCEPQILPQLPGSLPPDADVSPTMDYAVYESLECDCIGRFSPVQGKKYVLSAWVKEIPDGHIIPVNTLETYTAPQVKVEFFDSGNILISGSTQTFSSGGNIIEGWQRIFNSFDVPSNAASIKVSLLNISASNASAYFDDIRIHPFDGNMVSYVYDPVTLKLAAELDANNYATFYVYDDEGQLTKVKKETTEGIKTIREGRINNVVK